MHGSSKRHASGLVGAQVLRGVGQRAARVLQRGAHHVAVGSELFGAELQREAVASKRRQDDLLVLSHPLRGQAEDVLGELGAGDLLQPQGQLGRAQEQRELEVIALREEIQRSCLLREKSTVRLSTS